MQTFLIIAAGQGLLLSLGLISSVFYKRWSNLFLGLIVLIFSLEILNTWALQIRYHEQEGIFPFWVFSSYLIIPAALFLFGKLNTKPQFKITRKHFLLFLPAIIEIFSEIGVFIANEYYGQLYNLFAIPIWFFFTEILPPFSILFAIIIAMIDLRNLRKQTNAFLGKMQGWHLVKVAVFYGLLTLVLLLWLAETVIHPSVFTITLYIFCISIFLMGYLAYFQPNFFRLPSYLTKPNAFNRSENAQASQEAKRIHDIFMEKKLYTQARLTLKEAAIDLGIPSRQLSELINQQYGVDFRGYINALRIEEVIKKVEAGELQQKTLLGIALEAGFNSKSAFNKTYKDLKGKSTSDYFSK